MLMVKLLVIIVLLIIMLVMMNWGKTRKDKQDIKKMINIMDRMQPQNIDEEDDIFVSPYISDFDNQDQRLDLIV